MRDHVLDVLLSMKASPDLEQGIDAAMDLLTTCSGVNPKVWRAHAARPLLGRLARSSAAPKERVSRTVG